MPDFTPEVCEALKAYVYRLEDPRTGQTFYIGKGTANRAFAHARQAIQGEQGLRYDCIREISEAGLEPRIVIHRHGLDDQVALEIEAALIDAYSSIGTYNGVRGHDADRGVMTAAEVGERYGGIPAQIEVPAILIKIEKEWHPALTDDQLYERTRRYWRCNPENQDIHPTHALSIARGLIREVYEIDAWETYPDMSVEALDPSRLQQDRSRADRGGQWRRGFIGRASETASLRTSLVGKSVRHVPFGTGNPIAYVNCSRKKRLVTHG